MGLFGGSYMQTPVTLFIKALFLTTVILQVVIWPSVITITFTSAFGLNELIKLCYMPWKANGFTAALLAPDVFLLRQDVGDAKGTMLRPRSKSGYLWMFFLGVYFSLYFGLFVAHELDNQPFATMWIKPSILGNYTLYPDRIATLPFDVTSDESSEMRKHQFVWSKHMHGPAVQVAGAINSVGPAGAALACPQPGGGNAAPYACYAKLLGAQPPGDAHYQGRPFVPLPDTLYHVQARITPPAGVACASLEAYRVTLDADRNVVHALDYPSSTTATSSQRSFLAPVLAPVCGLFGAPTWCLQVAHTFSDAEYRQQIREKCAEHGQKLVLSLPNRAPDIDYDRGRINPDILVVTAGAGVELYGSWSAPTESSDGLMAWFWMPWKQVVHDDSAKHLRAASDDGAIFLKYATSVIPLLIVWYYLATDFISSVASNETLFLCIFVLSPAILLFLSIGAWLPMAGCIICAMAVHYMPPQGGKAKTWNGLIRPTLLFITAATNSIEIAWLIALICQAGYSSFFYETTLRQLYDLSHKFIITDSSSPMWTALVLPSTLILTAILLLASGIAVVLEVMAEVFRRRRTYASFGP